MKLRAVLAVLSFLLLSTCTPALLREERWDQEGYVLTFKNIESSRITAVEYSTIINTTPERLWNAVSDVDAMFKLTNAYRLLEGPYRQPDDSIRMVVEINSAWYAPAVTSVLVGRLLPDQLGWENECITDLFDGCYMRFTIAPADDGRRSIIHASGFVKRPWFVSHGYMVSLLKSDVRDIGEGLNFLAPQSKYDKRNTLFPWLELRHLSQAGPRPADGPKGDGKSERARIAVQKFVTYPDVSTSNAIASIAADYLATQLTTLNRFDVVAPSDLNLMARYLGENWALLCTDNDDCRKRLAGMAEAQFILSGELRSDPANYHLSLVLLDEEHGRAVWRLQESVAPDLQAVKTVLDEATRSLNAAVSQ